MPRGIPRGAVWSSEKPGEFVEFLMISSARHGFQNDELAVPKLLGGPGIGGCLNNHISFLRPKKASAVYFTALHIMKIVRLSLPDKVLV